MTQRALNFLAAIAIACIIGLVSLAFAPGEHTATSTTLSGVLSGSVIAIAALVSPQQSRSVEADLRRPGGQ